VLPTRTIGYVSLLYYGIGLLALLGLFALATIPAVYSLGTTNDRLLWAFTARGIATYWVLGAALGTLYYVIPRVTRNPLSSGGLALVAFLGWLAFAGLSAVGALVDPSVPYVITTLGQAGTLLLLAPTFLAVANLTGTIRGAWSLLLSPGSLQFAVTALAFLIATALLESVGALRSVQTLTAGTDWALGVSLLGLLGSATFAFYAFADHAVPRILRRDFGEALLAQAQLWTTFIGVVVTSLAMIGGGLVQGSLQSQGAAPQDVQGALFFFRIAAAGALGLVSLAALALVVNLFLAYTEGRPVDSTVVAGEPLAAGH
jgi:cytochrome c oxidase cbb3-type subunit 1